MITQQDIDAAEKECAQWQDIEARAQNEERISEVFAAAGLPLLKITTQDRLRGAIVTAMAQIQIHRSDLALTTLNEALKL